MKFKKIEIKKKKTIIIALVLIISLIVVGNIANKNRKYNNVEDFKSIKELVEYYGCTYIKMSGSEEDGYEKDIYITFAEDPITDTGYSKKTEYEKIISQVEAKAKNKDIRIIDESRNITIRIKYDSNSKVANYTINNISNYFDIMESKYQIENSKTTAITSINIKSELLNSILDNNWNKKSIALANKTTECDDYDIYYNDGYKVKTLNGKIYNIIFNSKYTKEIAENIKTGMTNEEIKKQLGNPSFEDANNQLIGYKTEKLYMFFKDGEISIYRVEELNQETNSKFAELVTKLNTSGDYKTFLNNLTDLYPDYSEYIQSDSYVSIKYPLKGIFIKFGAKEKNGITIYNNYKGKIAEEVSIDDIKDKKILPANVYTKLDTDMVYETEQSRVEKDYGNRHPIDGIELAMTTKYVVLKQDSDMYSFYSIDKKEIDSTIRIANFQSIKSVSENEFTYVTEDGTTKTYNAETLESK